MGKFLVGLAVVLALVIGALVWALSDPNRFKGELTALIQDQTGLTVNIDGELAWRLWPPVQLLARDVAADWVEPGDAPLVRAAELRVDADLLPLLSADPRLTVDGIALNGLVANLVQTGDVANWTPPGMEGTPPPVPVPAPRTNPGPDWEIATVSITDATINYTQDGEMTRVDLRSLSLSDLAPDRDIPLRAKASIDSAGLATDVAIDGTLRTNPALDTWAVRDATLTVADARMALDAELDVATTAASGHVELPAQRIPKLLELFDVDHDEPLAAAFDFAATAQSVALAPLTASAFGSNLEGKLIYTLTGKPRADFAFDVDRVVIEPAAAPAVALGAPGTLGLVAAAGAPQPSDAPLLPLETLREIDWAGAIAIADLVYDGASFPGSRIETRNESGRINTTLLLPSFFGGSAKSAVAIDARSDTPVWRVTPELSDVKSEPLMAWLDQRLYWVALLLANGEFEMRGNTERALLSSIKGRSRFDGGQGTMDIARLKQAMQAVAQLAGGSERIDAWPERLDYKRLIGNWTVDGQRHVMDLALDNMALAMNGTYDPFTDVMDMKIDLTVKNDPEIQTFKVNSLLMDTAIPIRCTGPTTAPTCRADQDGVKRLLAKALTGQGGAETTQQIDKAIEENVPEEHRDAARQLLRGFGEILKQSQPAQ